MEAAKNSTLTAEKRHFERVEHVREMLVETKKEYVKEKEALIAAKKKYENELAKLEEERAQADARIRESTRRDQKAREAQRLQLQNKRVMLDEASEALKEVKKQRDVIEVEHKASLATANENFQRTETRMNAEKAKLKQMEEKHRATLKDIENKVETADSTTEDIIRQIENADRDFEKKERTRAEVRGRDGKLRKDGRGVTQHKVKSRSAEKSWSCENRRVKRGSGGRKCRRVVEIVDQIYGRRRQRVASEN